MQTAVKLHSLKEAFWVDATGTQVPLKFVPAIDKVKENLAAKILKQAQQAETQLQLLHQLMRGAFTEVEAMVKEQYKIKGKAKETKGNITWYNFDKSIKIEADVNEISKWDDALMTEAHQLLKNYLNRKLGDTVELVKDLVDKAFSNSKGTIDSKKVFSILRYKEKIQSKDFQKACELMLQAQGIDKTKLYMRIWVKQTTGEYKLVNLNFSAI